MSLAPPSEQHRRRHHSSHSLNPSKEYSNDEEQERTDYIIDTFLKIFTNDIRENPKGWRNRFRKMAKNEFSFYRGSAVLFYRDMQYDSHYDRWLKNSKEASRVFIHVSIKHYKKISVRYIIRYSGRSAC